MIISLNDQLEAKTTFLNVLQNDLIELKYDLDNIELNPDYFKEDYDEMLDCETVEVCGMTFNPSDILKNCDPTAYRCGLLDYLDSIDKEDTEEGQELLSQIENLEEQINIEEGEIEALTEEIDSLEE